MPENRKLESIFLEIASLFPEEGIPAMLVAFDVGTEESICYCSHAILQNSMSKSAFKRIVAKIFWAMWLDQAVYCVTSDRNPEIYLDFREHFHFPKFYYHGGSSNVQLKPENWIMVLRNLCHKNEMATLLLLSKGSFYYLVRNWIVDHHGIELWHLVNNSLRDDLGARVSEDLIYLLDDNSVPYRFHFIEN